MRRRVAAEDLLLGRRAAFAPRERLEQRGEPLRPLRVVTRRMQLREPRVAQDVDCALPSSRSASAVQAPRRAPALAPPSQSGSRVRKLGQRRLGVHRRDALVEAQLVRLRGEASVVEHRLERLVLREQRRGGLRPDALRAGQLVRGIAAQRDEVRHLLRLDAVALAHLVRADARDLADAANRLEHRRPLAHELERVAVAARDERRAAARLLVRRRPRRGSRPLRSPAPCRPAKSSAVQSSGSIAELLEQGLVEDAARLVARRTPRACTSAPRACPSRRRPRAARSAPTGRSSCS